MAWTLLSTLESCATSKLTSIRELFDLDPEGYSLDPKKLLYEASTQNTEHGSSTMVVATIDQTTKSLRTSMIGDSGYMIVRPTEPNGKNYELYFKSKEQQHSFNFPYQVGTDGDSPEKALTDEHPMQKGYIVVLGTDGLFDNLYAEEVVDEINAFLSQQDFDAAEIAKHLADSAFKLSLNTEDITPFAENARKAGYKYKGGKSDDITVVVAKIGDK